MKIQSQNALSWAGTERAYKAIHEEDVFEQFVSVVQRTSLHNDKNGSSTDKYCEREKGNVTLNELRKGLIANGSMVQAIAAHLSNEKASTLKKCFKEKADDSECQGEGRMLDYTSCYSEK